MPHTKLELEKRNQQLSALHKAAMAIAAELSLDNVLQQIVDSARELVGAEYAALGVPNADGFMETFVYSGMSKETFAKMPHLPHGLGLLGALYHAEKPIRIPNISDDPRAVGFPEHHPIMTSFLGVPILGGGRSLGNLYLTNKIDGDEFTEEDEAQVEMLAAHAAIAIQNARLYEQVGRLAVVEERARIGMDLHDGVIQSIYAVGLTLESARLTLHDSLDETDMLLSKAIESLNDTIRDIRNFILDLRPHRFRGDLEQGVSRLVREFQANTMTPVDVSLMPGLSSRLSTPAARAVFLTTQEALANIARHAKATQVEIRTVKVGNNMKLTVTDNGRGFEVDKKKKSSVGHGLSNMRARAEALKGSFHIDSAPGEGTKITLILPLNPE